MPNITNIPAPRVPLTNSDTGLISREWYMFFFNLFNLTGGGQNPVSIEDILTAPADSELSTALVPIANQFQALDSAANEAQYTAESAQIYAALQALAVQPTNNPQIVNRRYGSFFDTTDQTAAAINTAYAMTFNSTDYTNGVYIGSPTSRVYVDRNSLYNIQFSAQLDKTAAVKSEVWIWLDKNGTSVANSATQVSLQGSNPATVAAWNFLLELNAGDYFRLMWATDNTGSFISASPSVAPVPAIPSVILTVTDNIRE